MNGIFRSNPVHHSTGAHALSIPGANPKSLRESSGPPPIRKLLRSVACISSLRTQASDPVLGCSVTHRREHERSRSVLIKLMFKRERARCDNQSFTFVCLLFKTAGAERNCSARNDCTGRPGRRREHCGPGRFITERRSAVLLGPVSTCPHSSRSIKDLRPRLLTLECMQKGKRR